jgi:NAD(P)-dependent dehydrogenase (short-subunit alcohol dehydrogenase family)
MKKIKELMDIGGRVALITGGAGHIGGAIAEALAELGAGIAIVDLSPEACSRVCKKVTRDFGVEAFPAAADLSRDVEVRKVPGKVMEKFGRLDILINCAAFVGASKLPGWTAPFEEQNADTWRKALDLNLTVPFILTQSCAPFLKRSGHGSVINIASTYGLVGPDMRLYEGTKMGNPAAYAASKGGLLQLTRWLATVLAPDIRVNAITPGGIQRGQAKTFRKRYVSKTPLGRMGREEDLKGAAAYLASDLSSYVTGQNLIVDGGWTAW